MKNRFYNISNLENEKITIDIDGVIGSWWDGSEDSKNTKEQITDFLKEIGSSTAKTILVRISSPGGNVDDGLSIHDALKNHPASIEVEVTGMTASAATIISQAADKGKLKMSDNSLYLVHKAWTYGGGNSNQMNAIAEDLKTIDSVISRIYSKRSGKSLSEVNSLMNVNDGEGKWLTAEQAKEEGLIDEIFLTEGDNPEIDNNISVKDFHNKFAAMAGKMPLPEFKNTATITNNIEEVSSMENEKIFTAEEMEAAKKETIENISKHLGWIDKAENATIIENIKAGKNYADCVDVYAEEKISKIESAVRIEEMKPEGLEHHDAIEEMKPEGKEDLSGVAKNMGLI